MNRVVHFEIHADDLERCAKFYREVFGWKIEKWEGMDYEYYMVLTAEMGDMTIPGISGGMLKRPMPLAKEMCGSNAFVCTIDVENFDESAEKVLAAGGKAAKPKFAIPNMAWCGYFIDTEGNTFGLFQEDKSAK